MDAAAWNANYPPGSWVIVTLANRKRIPARTLRPALRIGQHDFIEVDAIRPGYVLLSWCWPVKPGAPTRAALFERLARVPPSL